MQEFCRKRLSFFCNSPEIGFCKALIICDLDGVLLLQDGLGAGRHRGKEFGGAYILGVDYVLKYQY